ncbi:MAG TPA: hypothetical protein VGN61_09975, partial [Verrucomicrobiae bacterium]
MKTGSIVTLIVCLTPVLSGFGVEPTQWVSRGPGGGGALFSPSFSPYRAGEMYLACDMTEVFHSINYGTTWSVLNFAQIEGGRQALVQFTSNSNVL